MDKMGKMTGRAFVRRVRRYARQRRLAFRLDPSQGKGDPMVAYPALLEPEEDGGCSMTFRDLPEANAFGDDLEQTLRAAIYGLAVALEFRIRDDEPWPNPSPIAEGERQIALPVLIEAKLALMRRMHETGTTRVELARLLDISEGGVRRLPRFDQRSHIGQIEAALEKLGSRLELRLRQAA